MPTLYLPRPRSISFSLRTLFALLTLLGIGMGWLAWQVEWIRARHEFVRSHDGDQVYPNMFGQATPPAPGVLPLLGEQGIWSIDVSRMSQDETAQARRLFPEARIPWDQ